MEKKSFYITTTLPYVNSDPHVGFAMELIRADVIARYQKSLGKEVFFNTGTDEHGKKLLADAESAGIPVKEYVDGYAEKFRELIPLLGVSEDVHFIRTTDAHHESAAQELWRRVRDNGFIYKKNYQSKYCVGCELEKTDSELVDGRCPIHPNKDLEIIDEENYFFDFKKCEPLLKKLYEDKPTLVIPDFRFNEAKAFLERGLEDFSISRLKEKMPWGVAVPDDDKHVMYVWFDALTNYISTLGWPENTEKFETFWKEGTPVQYCGKDNLRQQSMMWQAMLMAADLPTTDHIIINGFINSGGQKMSKSLGNVISPVMTIERFKPFAGELASDVLRYYLLRHMNSFEDADMTDESINEAYQANLANGLGNLVSRIMTLSEKYLDKRAVELITEDTEKLRTSSFISGALDDFDVNLACQMIWNSISKLDKRIADEESFKLVKTDKEKAKNMFVDYVYKLADIAHGLQVILPKTSEKIFSLIKENKKPEVPLFLRKD